MPGGTQPDQSVPDAAQAPSTSAGLMSLISDVERQLAGLRDADAQRRALEDALATRETAVAAREHEAREATARAEALTHELESKAAELTHHREETERLRTEVEQARSDIAAQRNDLDRELERISALETSVKERAALSEKAAAEAEQRRAQMERAIAEKSAAFRVAEERMEQRVTEVSALLDQAQRQAAENETRASELASELASARAEIQSLHERAKDPAEIDALRTALSERENLLQSLRADLDAARSLAEDAERTAQTAAQEITRLTSDAASQARVIAERNDELKSLRAQVATLKDKSGADAKGRADAAALQTRIEALEKELAARSAEADSLREDLEKATTALQAATRQSEEYLAHIAHVEADLASARTTAGDGPDADTALQAAKEAESKARAEADKLRAFARTLAEELAQARAGGEPSGLDPDQTSLRRQRLARQRKLLRAQSDKIKRASDAVRDRFEQVEQILSQRAEVIAAKKLVDETKRKARSRQARAGAVAAVFYVALTLLIYAGLGWLAAAKVAPAVYSVSSRIAADAGGRPLSPAELDEWRTYHEDLLADPRTLDLVAERMKQRGIASLGTVPSLKIRLDADFSSISREPGTLDLELRGLGAGKTARELDTLVATVVRQANSARERRVDGSTTIVATAATPDPEPLHDERVFYAAGIAGGLTLLSTIAAWILWRKLYEAKASVERHDEFDGLMDDRRWQAPARPAK
mgnify:CR=1 FL=1